MTAWEKQAYREMRSSDRVLILMMKIQDLIDFKQVLTDEDLKLIKFFVETESKKREVS